MTPASVGVTLKIVQFQLLKHLIKHLNNVCQYYLFGISVINELSRRVHLAFPIQVILPNTLR